MHPQKRSNLHIHERHNSLILIKTKMCPLKKLPKPSGK
ncbi:hypothetical protein ACHAWC_010942 [Mediolabrus comicus]